MSLLWFFSLTSESCGAGWETFNAARFEIIFGQPQKFGKFFFFSLNIEQRERKVNQPEGRLEWGPLTLNQMWGINLIGSYSCCYIIPYIHWA